MDGPVIGGEYVLCIWSGCTNGRAYKSGNDESACGIDGGERWVNAGWIYLLALNCGRQKKNDGGGGQQLVGVLHFLSMERAQGLGVRENGDR